MDLGYHILRNGFENSSAIDTSKRTLEHLSEVERDELEKMYC